MLLLIITDLPKQLQIVPITSSQYPANNQKVEISNINTVLYNLLFSTSTTLDLESKIRNSTSSL